MATSVTTAARLAGKSHYRTLDGLRGVASVLVVVFHLFEVYAYDNRFVQVINHGYLAVDFFFLLSGFVVAYAYDDRWGRMGVWEFFKRRLIRLQPMVVAGMVVGACLYYFGTAPAFPLIHQTPVWKMLLVMAIGMTMVPVPTALDIRGWWEMHPLDGPAWSLFFEYIANVLYAVVLRRVSRRVMAVLTLLAAAFLFQYLVFGPEGDVIGGWNLTPTQLHVGFARLLYPFFAGVLLLRSGWRIPVRRPFVWCSGILLVVFCLPRFGGAAHLWVNGLYEFVCIAVVFPVVVAMGAGEQPEGRRTERVSGGLGAISYPLYITHYPLIYVYWSWVRRGHVPGARGAVVGAGLLVVAVGMAWALLRFYDEPVRAWLTRRFDGRRSVPGGVERGV